MSGLGTRPPARPAAAVPVARPRARRDRWSPEPTTEEGRRRRTRARWATAGIVVAGVVFQFAHLAARERRREAVGPRVTDPSLDFVVVRARVREEGGARAVEFALAGTQHALALAPDGPEVTRYPLPLPADDAAVERTAAAIAADLLGRGAREPWFEFGALSRDDDRAVADRVAEALATRGHPPGNRRAGR